MGEPLKVKTRRLCRIISTIEDYSIDLNYGLSPNPFGFSYIVNDDYVPRTCLLSLERDLNSISGEEEEFLRRVLYK